MNETVTHLLCPITLELPVEPVIAEDGNVYERVAIEAQFKVRCKSPLTNEPMGTKLMVAKHVTNVLDSLVQAKVDDERLIAWRTAKEHAKKGVARKRVSAEHVRLLLHAFHCRQAICKIDFCTKTKVIIKRIAVHVRHCQRTSDDCAICKLWQALHHARLPPRSNPA